MTIDPEKLAKPVVEILETSARLVKWDQPNTIVLKYLVDITTNDHGIEQKTTTEPQIEIPQFQQGHKYAIQVAAINSAGQGSLSDVLIYSESKSVCLLYAHFSTISWILIDNNTFFYGFVLELSPPTDVKAILNKWDQMTCIDVTFTEPDLGCESFKIVAIAKSTNLKIVCETNKTTFTIEGLYPGESYEVSVASVNKVSESDLIKADSEIVTGEHLYGM